MESAKHGFSHPRMVYIFLVILVLIYFAPEELEIYPSTDYLHVV